MLAFFVSIIILTAGIATGVLFHVFPQNQSQEVKGVIIASEPTVHVSETFSSSSEITDEPSLPLSPTPSTISPTFQPTPTPSTPLRQGSAGQASSQPSQDQVPSGTWQGSGGQAGSSTPTPTSSVSITPSISPVSPSPVPTQVSPTPNVVPTISETSGASSSADTRQGSTSQEDASNGASQGLNADIIFNMVNTHRTMLGLPAFVKDNATCTIAQQRAPQVYNEIFVTGNVDAGLKAMNIPYWITENIIYDDTEADAVNWWLNDSIHKQIMEGNYTYSCVACSGNACAEIFTNYIAK